MYSLSEKGILMAVTGMTQTQVVSMCSVLLVVDLDDVLSSSSSTTVPLHCNCSIVDHHHTARDYFASLVPQEHRQNNIYYHLLFSPA